jgi:hypothetical protein
MKETILNIYLIIEKNNVVGFRAISYSEEGDDEDKIQFLKSRVREDFDKAEDFPAPVNRLGKFMSYNKFYKLEKQGMHFQLFENIFQTYDVPENPLICVTPVVDGEIWDGTEK